MEEQRIDGLQWLRAVMSLFVVIWHLGGGGKSALFYPDKLPNHSFQASDFVNFQVLLLAVPTFMLISTYLLALAGGSMTTALRRSQRVALLVLFWPVLWMLYQGGWASLPQNLPATPGDTVTFVLTAGHTIYYFFVSLILAYALTSLAAALPLAVNVLLLLVAVIAVAGAPVFSIQYNLPLLSAYWSPVNFLPYPFAGVIIWRALDRDAPSQRLAIVSALLLAAYCGFSYLEWMTYPNAVFFPGQQVAYPAYTRPSLVAGAMLLLLLAIHTRPGLPKVIDFMASYSLALYLLHLFVAEPVQAVIRSAAMDPLVKSWIVIIVTLPATYATARALSSVFKERLMF